MQTMHMSYTLKQTVFNDVKKNNDDPYYGIQRKLSRLKECSEAEVYECNTIQDFQNVIKRSNHPLKKEMLELMFCKRKS